MLSLLREDRERQEQGSPCYILEMTFFVKRIGTNQAKQEIKEIREKLYGLFPKPDEIDENEIFAHWLAEYGVVGWEEVVNNETDEPIEFNRSFARKLFLNEEYWLSLNQALIAHAMNYENFLHEQAYKDIEELKKP